ncbi:hypothetical protein MMC13_008183 [Lambiella insularis]|nr:hypothetical protein [Lambiella insularis]
MPGTGHLITLNLSTLATEKCACPPNVQAPFPPMDLKTSDPNKLHSPFKCPSYCSQHCLSHCWKLDFESMAYFYTAWADRDSEHFQAKTGHRLAGALAAAAWGRKQCNDLEALGVPKEKTRESRNWTELRSGEAFRVNAALDIACRNSAHEYDARSMKLSIKVPESEPHRACIFLTDSELRELLETKYRKHRLPTLSTYYEKIRPCGTGGSVEIPQLPPISRGARKQRSHSKKTRSLSTECSTNHSAREPRSRSNKVQSVGTGSNKSKLRSTSEDTELEFSVLSPDLAFEYDDDEEYCARVYCEISWSQPFQEARAKFELYFKYRATRLGLIVKLPYPSLKHGPVIAICRMDSKDELKFITHPLTTDSSETIILYLDDFGPAQPEWNAEEREEARMGISVKKLADKYNEAIKEREIRAQERKEQWFKTRRSVRHASPGLETDKSDNANNFDTSDDAQNSSESDDSYEPDDGDARQKRPTQALNSDLKSAPSSKRRRLQ